MKIRSCFNEQREENKGDTAACLKIVLLILLCVFLVFSVCNIFMGGSSSKSDMAAPIIVRETEKHMATLIFLHGLGDTGMSSAAFVIGTSRINLKVWRRPGEYSAMTLQCRPLPFGSYTRAPDKKDHGWADAFKQLKLKNIRCICPTAPVMPVTLNAGYRMPSWFDLISLSPEGPEDEAGIKKAAEMLKELISAQDVTPDKVIIGGFSQGGALALYTALTMDKPVMGIVGLSTWMPLHKRFAEGVKVNRDIPMFQGHGTIDPLVSPVFGELTAKVLKTMSSKHTFKTYPMMHTSCPEEMEDVKTFLTDLVKE